MGANPLRPLLFATLPIGAALACSDVSVVDDGPGSGAGGAGASTGTSTASQSSAAPSSATSSTTQSASTGIVYPVVIAQCDGYIYACGDTVDNDLDGLPDAWDPDCLGPCDPTEDSLTTTPPHTDGACWDDCAFDQDAGPGNDECYWSTHCDPLEVPPSYYPEPSLGDYCAYDPAYTFGRDLTCSDVSANQSAQCGAFCLPRVPNGCDCFGCCELVAGSGDFRWLHSEGLEGVTVCTFDTALDPDRCHPCTPVPSCLNPCDTCEVCLGKPDVPAGCSLSDRCEPGLQACGSLDLPICPEGFYCTTGCCQPVVP